MNIYLFLKPLKFSLSTEKNNGQASLRLINFALKLIFQIFNNFFTYTVKAKKNATVSF